MKDFQNLTLRCIKGQPINDVVCRRLTDMGFPVDAPRQSDKISAKFDSYFWKLNDSEYSICGRVETEYLSRLFEYKDREKSFSEVLDLLSEYGITEDELAAGLSSGCVYNLSFSEAETLYDEFVFLIQQLLPRQLSDIYYSFDIEPNPAHAVFFDMAAEQLGLARFTDRNKSNYGHFISHTSKGVCERIIQGESLLSIYENTCATKEIIKSSYSEVMRNHRTVRTLNATLMRIEVALFGLARKYRYSILSTLPSADDAFDFIVYEDGTPIIAIDYLGEDVINRHGLPFVDAASYDDLIHRFASKDKLCRANNVSYLQLDVRELEDGLYIGSLVRDVIKTPAYAKLHREERRDYFTYGRAIHDALGNYDVMSEATLCGCYRCGRIVIPSLIIEYDEYEDAAICPYCGATAIIADKQGYTISEDYLKALKQYLLVNELQEAEEDDDE